MRSCHRWRHVGGVEVAVATAAVAAAAEAAEAVVAEAVVAGSSSGGSISGGSKAAAALVCKLGECYTCRLAFRHSKLARVFHLCMLPGDPIPRAF